MTLKNDRDISTLVREIEKQKESKMENIQKVLKANEKYVAKEKERTKQKQLM